ncbi:UPF0655 protein [Neolecta irregularis DAH-3]|uniref:UPF0655 protein n=1 Tax=Neolecta irregularis (strain DAH-3) TaxID=1198029 RepID=A0A1U7LPZ3_NEOID|nr:UPF0655 protein [Neolecta irregularis DAH-3]|eukprot:OLL24714.1 UPF0655 protein [Neolecta irregularis DAH-3]
MKELCTKALLTATIMTSPTFCKSRYLILYLIHALDIFCDFDETITLNDTLQLVASAAYDSPNRAVANPPPWSFFVESYLADYAEQKQSYDPIVTLDQELDFLRSLEPIELKSVHRTEYLQLFKGITDDDIAKEATKVEFRNGWHQFVHEILGRGYPLCVISVNWSGYFISKALSLDTTTYPSIQVIANEIIMDADGHASGKLSKSNEADIRIGDDKKREMEQELKEMKFDGKSVYFGNSTGDLPCLLTADIGIIMGKDEDFLASLKDWNIQVVRKSSILTILDSASCLHQSSKKNMLLYQVDDWTL